MKQPELKKMPVASLVPADYNPREIDADAMEGLQNSIDKWGLVELIVWNERSGNVVGGHQRLKVLESMGVEETTVVVVDLDDVDEKAMNITLNSPEITGKFTPGLDDLLKQIKFERPDYTSLLKFEPLEAVAAKLLNASGPKDGNTEKDRVPEEVEHMTKPGDIWILGNHVLACGDSLDLDAVGRMMDGARADMVFTDPPWNVNYGGSDHPSWKTEGRKILNDHMDPEQWLEFVTGFCGTLAAFTESGAALYMVMSAQEWPVVDQCLRDAAFHWSSTIIWAKDRLVLSRKGYHTQYEPIWYGWNGTGARLRPLEDRTQSDLWEFKRPSVSDLHPTTKPVELIERALQNSSMPGDVILDLFGGSGSTLIACESTGRHARLMELDPKYCDVIIRRWQDFTGQMAERK